MTGTFTYTTAAGTVFGAGTGQSEAVTFTPSDSTDYTTASTTVTVNVAQAGTTTALSSSMNPTVYGQAVTFTATVASAVPSVGPPTGSVTFFAGATTLGSAPLSGGVASLAVTTLTVGSDSITAVYSGDPNFTGSPSTALSQTVDAGWHDHHGRSFGEPLGLRPVGHLHGHGQPNGARQWYADRDGHLHGRLDGAGLANTQRRGGNADHVEPVRFQPQGAKWFTAATATSPAACRQS